MKKVNIYTNGIALFTLENYGKTSGVCHVNGITLHSVVSQLTARAMHTKGTLHYIFGMGDRKALSNISLSRKSKFDNFKVN